MSAAAVIGFPIAHSKSPIIHRFWLEKLGLAGDYRRIEVAPDDLASFMEGLRNADLTGVNVTIPHKQAIISCCDEVTPLAAAVGAVNTVYKAGDRLVGHNTDAGGFTEPLRRAGWSGKTAVVIGSGGAARAVVWGLKSIGVGQIIILARSVSTAAQLLIDFDLDPARAFSLSQSADALAGTDILVNATSLGMMGKPELKLDLAPLGPDATVYDIVYAAAPTQLLVNAAHLGLKTHDGLGMLIGQAAEAFTLFFGAAPPRDPATEAELRRRLIP